MEILNRHHLKGAWPGGALYVGRGTVLGNPFVIGEDGTREEVIALYEDWLLAKVAARCPAVLTALAGVQHASSLVCYCAPLSCHAEKIFAVWQGLQIEGGINPRPSYHADGEQPRNGEVFVFGANLAGRHGAGAALAAKDRFGARIGQGEGYMGEGTAHCYAVPTKDERFATLPYDVIRQRVASFIRFAQTNPGKRFFVTRVGCGLAGYRDREIAPLFREASFARCSFPLEWRPHLENRTMTYAGIGSRKTPQGILELMKRVAVRLAELGYTLRSGGADGADTAFESGAGAKQIFLPWQGFNNRNSEYSEPTEAARRVASSLHPAWGRLGRGPQALHARNSHQILGPDLDSPADLVVCWTPDGCESEEARTNETGGTGQAIALSDRWNIPVFNLANMGALDRIAFFLKGT